MRRGMVAVAAVLLLATVLCGCGGGSSGAPPITGPPAIVFTHVPDYGTWGDPLKGRAKNVHAADAKVMVFIKVEGNWWVKPYYNSPFTPLSTDLSWACSITTGGIDQQATEIRAYLLASTYPESTTLPVDPESNANDDVLAMVSVTRTPK